MTLTLSTPNAAILYALASVNASILHAKDITAGTVDREAGRHRPVRASASGPRASS